MPRQTDAETRPEHQHAQRDDTNRRIARIQTRQRHRQRGHFRQVMFRHMRDVEAEKVFDLHGRDGNADAGGKAQRDRQRNILNQSPEARQPEQN